ncbi:MAG: phenylalanine--tRNA ligase subunit beta [Patescibacteria group bacterium]|nr:phenylalanine--tRNA ligase subunit beta [Patescibacteria group bacterium]MCL5432067.1 phenylalanine--tRNA ligase subunit beta [Patescibacteria group bacterium]
MLIPLSWLKEYVDIKIPFKDLAERLSEVGLTVETWHEQDGDIIFDPEVTPNRPDWMSVYGIAREIAAVTNSKLKNQNAKLQFKINKSLKIDIKQNYDLISRMTSVIIKDVKVKQSPEWLQKRIKQIGLRPINNLVDITNYVLWVYGSPLHVFDYDKIRGHQLIVEKSAGGEAFRSLDGIDYHLPNGAIIIKDLGRIVDLPPIKGGQNTAVSTETKTVLLHSVVCNPILSRRASQALGVRSDSSAVSERGVDPNGTVAAVDLALSLVLELAGGQVASEIMDHKTQEFAPWTVEMSHDRLEKILGIKISSREVKDILTRLGLEVAGEYKVTVPTFRDDLHIEEDLIEEVGRIHGYNNFPKTLPAGPVSTAPVAYARDFDLEFRVKSLLKGDGYSEIYTYSLVGERQLVDLGIDPGKTLRVDNPISRDFEYLRPRMIGNLLEAMKLNQANFSDIRLYELGKHYTGPTIGKAKEEYWLSGAQTGEKFYEVKGIIETLLIQFGVPYEIKPDNTSAQGHPGRSAVISSGDKLLGYLGEMHPALLARFGIKGHVSGFTINYDTFTSLVNLNKKYRPISKFPAVVQDVSLIIPEKVLYGDVLEAIWSTSKLIADVQLLDKHEQSTTLRITFQDTTKNLTDREVNELRAKILKKLAELGVKNKD